MLRLILFAIFPTNDAGMGAMAYTHKRKEEKSAVFASGLAKMPAYVMGRPTVTVMIASWRRSKPCSMSTLHSGKNSTFQGQGHGLR